MVMLFITSISIHAQNARSTVSGTVVSPDKISLENVSVSIEGTHYGALSDENGKFRFSGPIGQYMLVVSSLDHKSYKSAVNLKRGENTFNIVLTEKAHELTEVVVEAAVNRFSNKESEYIARLPLKNLENPQVYSVIGKDLIKEQIIVNFDDALKNSSGIDKLWSSTGRGGDGAAYFTIRGFAV
jgi:iron complex outermembrane receptor protein